MRHMIGRAGVGAGAGWWGLCFLFCGLLVGAESEHGPSWEKQPDIVRPRLGNAERNGKKGGIHEIIGGVCDSVRYPSHVPSSL